MSNADDVAAIEEGYAAADEAETYRRNLRLQAWDAVHDLEGLIDTDNAVIKANPGPYIKGLARILKVLIFVTLDVVEKEL